MMNTNTAFDLVEGIALREEGMSRAADRRKECLAACRAHLVELAIRRESGCVTADDAYLYIEQHKLEPLGNAAGSLFKAKCWEFTGEWSRSERVSNHGHQNRVYRYIGEDCRG